MKKRIGRIVVYFALAVGTGVVISHPYVWQSIFGPKIKGEPLWAWQEEFRSRWTYDGSSGSPWAKLLSVAKLDTRPISWIGHFPAQDPEMLPVLLSLAEDGDYSVRTGVAYALHTMPADEATIAALDRMLDDESSNVKIAAMHTLRGFGADSAAALPKLHERMKDADPYLQATAALAVVSIHKEAPQARAIIRSGIKSPNFNVRRTCLSGLDESIQGDDPMFAILMDLSLNDPDGPCQRASLSALRQFGKRAVPHLIGIMTSKSPNRYDAMDVLGMIGPEAKDAIPALQSLHDKSDIYLRARISPVLERIDPARRDKKQADTGRGP